MFITFDSLFINLIYSTSFRKGKKFTVYNRLAPIHKNNSFLQISKNKLLWHFLYTKYVTKKNMVLTKSKIHKLLTLSPTSKLIKSHIKYKIDKTL